VGERLGRGHIGKLVTASSAERSTGGGEHQRVHHLRRPALEALKGGGVLAVDRQQPPSSTPPRCGRKIAGRDEALLYCDGQVDAPLECPERRRQAREATHGL